MSDYTFTGQRAERGLGLMDYQARYYDSYLNRFISADTIVAEPGNPQSLNRYSYVNNSPLRFNDPTGHSRPLPPCSTCQVEIDTSNWSDLAKGLAVPLSFLTGFHADREQNLVTGPTEQEWMESSLTNMVNPIGMVAQPVQRGARGIQRILPGFEDLVGPKVWQDILKQSPLENHHILTNKHGTRWTAEFEKILKDYGLDIKDKWNVANIRHPQTGGHPQAYHEWALEQLEQIRLDAGGDKQKFLSLFNERIKQPVEEHPEMLLDEFWEIIGK